MTTDIEQLHRQVLVNLGNRYVAFSSALSLPQTPVFDPAKVSELLPRVADESEAAYERIVQTLRVSGLAREEMPGAESEGEVTLTDENGNVKFVEIKIRSTGLKSRDIDAAFERIRAASSNGKTLEVWFL